MEIASSLSSAFQSQQPLIIASIITLLSLLLTLRSFIKKPPSSASSASLDKEEPIPTPSSCNGTADSLDLYAGASAQEVMAAAVVAVDIMPAPVVERQTGASMMEQLVPEITTHALSYLDYPSLCRLSMTNSLMRKAANDDNAWKALYHKALLHNLAGNSR
ncbi:hypothetical protein SLEP1_g40330 [Rubroshorea leprosula]|uniref:F-box domain-containing protein n=1 Tax=Rubroshorea leprosula TaxID=152421 RepID=A0AAV5L3I8_9ROSI|nr:hypothetical protein SLEP1_g40330 [Rubroshorea leprosula]